MPPDYNKCETYKVRGEEDTDAVTFKTAEEVVNYFDDCDFHYFYIDGVWCIWEEDNKFESVLTYLKKHS